MNKGLSISLSAVMLAMASTSVSAQDSDYHPVMSDNFILSIGAFRSDSSFTISANGSEIGDDIDFGNSVGVDESNTLVNGQLRWKFGRERKWYLWGQYFESNNGGDATLTEDITFGDITFREGTFVEGGVDISVARLFLGRSFVKNAQHDFGAGIGIHNLDISAYIGGEIKINDETTGYQREEIGGSQILPNIGAWYNFSPAKRWLLHGRVDWISANINEYDGTMWNFNAGVNFQAWKHVGFDLSYQYFNIDLSVDDGDWVGGAEMKYSGPVLGMTFNW
jgi:opacity protein-like surface antigen